MKHARLGILFLGNLIIVSVGMGLFPVLPLYAADFGATSTVAGLYLAGIYAALTGGTMLTGWLAERIAPTRLFAGAGALGIPALVLIGQATSLWQVVLLTAVVWFSGGVGLGLTSVFTGLVADEKHRGTSFSLMAVATPLGSVVGGAMVAKLIAWQGYPLMFAALGATWLALPVVGLLGLRNVQGTRSASEPADGAGGRLGHTFYLLMLIFLLSSMAMNAGRLGTSLSMQLLRFSPSAVAGTATVSGLVAIPVTFLIGALSDRLGRQRFLMLGVVLVIGASALLSAATHLWQFWLAATLLLVSTTVSTAVSSAFATDLLPSATLRRGLPWLSAMPRLAGVVSFAGAGYVTDTLGTSALYAAAAGTAVIAALVLGLLPHEQRPVESIELHVPSALASRFNRFVRHAAS